MKKIISLLLAVLMLVSFVSCNNVSDTEDLSETANETANETAEEKETEKGVHEADGVFAAGFSREIFTPENQVNLAGYAGAEKRLCKSVKNDVCSSCLAIKDASGKIALMFSLDILQIDNSVASGIRGVISRDTGVPEENISISCTHTHEAPNINMSTPQVTVWSKIFYKAMKTSAQKAIADLDAAEIYENTTKVPNLNFIRRYKTADGKIVSAGDSKENAVGYETEVDDALQVIKFDRKNQKDIVLVNWRAHPCHDGGETATVVSADYIHYMRKAVEKDGFDCIYFQGACGNIGSDSALPAVQNEKWAHYTVEDYGKTLANAVRENIKDMNKIEAGNVKTASKVVTIEVDHSEDNKAAQAAGVASLMGAANIDAARELAAELGFDSMWHASAVYDKSRQGKTKDMTISALSIGDAAFIFAPYEMFDTNGMQVKNASPFKQTFVCELSNSSWSYFPAEGCFKSRGYEVCQFRYVKGTAEQIADGFIDLLNTLYEK